MFQKLVTDPKFGHMSELMGSIETAEFLNRDRSWVLELARRGEIPAQKLPGRTGAYVFKREDVEQFKASLDAPADETRAAS
jgi:excisionase family DNA binding protein